MRIELQPAYVLHTRHYQNTSMLVDFLTPDFGRVSAVVRGVRANSKAAKQRRCLIQPFVPLLIGWGGKNALKTLYDIEAESAPIPLTGKNIYSGLYVNELLTRLIHHSDESEELFYLYQQTLQSLLTHPMIDVALRNFEFRLLEFLGYGLCLDTDVESGEMIIPEGDYQFFADKGFIRRFDQRVAADRFTGIDLLHIANLSYNAHTRMVAKRLCRQALAFHLGGKPLKSRDLFG